MDLAYTNFRVFVILIILIIIATAEEEGTPEVPPCRRWCRNGGTRRRRGAGTVVPEAAVSVGKVEPDANVSDAEGWVEAGIPDDAVVLDKDEDAALDESLRSDTRRLALDAGKTDRNARWTVSSTSCCS